MKARMRTIDQTAELLRESDPETAITKTALRRLAVTGQLPGVVMVGRKYLVNLDVLERFLSGQIETQEPEGGIRRVTDAY